MILTVVASLLDSRWVEQRVSTREWLEERLTCREVDTALHARGRVYSRAQVFLALCLWLVVAITNYERGDNPGSTVITV